MSKRIDVSYETQEDAEVVLSFNGTDFRVTPPPGWQYVKFVKLAGAGTPEAMLEIGPQLFGMFERMMAPEEFARFQEFADSPEGPPLEKLMGVLDQVASAAADLPQQPSGGSSNGRRKTRSGSREASPGPGTTPTPSPSGG